MRSVIDRAFVTGTSRNAAVKDQVSMRRLGINPMGGTAPPAHYSNASIAKR